MIGEMVKVLFVACRHSPFDLNAGSGKDYDLHQALVSNGADVRVVGPFDFKPNLAEHVIQKLHSILVKRRPAKYNTSFLKKSAAAVMQVIPEYKPDVIFSKYAGILCRLETDIPIVTLCDTTLFGSHSEWPMFTLLAYIQQNSWERKAYRKARAIITHSQWSADILTREYHQPASKISCFPVPASIPSSVIPKTITTRTLKPLKLLLVGREYERKGIDIAIDVARLLNQSGVETQLRIVGFSGQDRDHVRFMGLYNKTIPEQLRAYVNNYQWANFLIHPARFEAAGIVPSEAAAFGTPTITNNVGGLGTTVEDGVSGIVLPKNSSADAYVSALKTAIGEQAAYDRLCETTRERYERELNWEAAGRVFFETVKQALA